MAPAAASFLALERLFSALVLSRSQGLGVMDSRGEHSGVEGGLSDVRLVPLQSACQAGPHLLAVAEIGRSTGLQELFSSPAASFDPGASGC